MLVFTVTLLTLLLVFSSELYAVGGGGFRNEAALDAEANGMADCFVAQADSPSAVHFNPAGLTQLEGSYVRIGNTVQAPRNFHTNTSGNESSMQMQTFDIPSLYLANDFGLERWRFGLSATSPYGLGTDWADDSFSSVQATESNTEFFQLNPSVAYKVNDALSIGVGVDYMTSHVSKHKRILPALGGGDFQLKGNDDGWGYNVGVLYKHSEKHSLGVSYRSEIELIYEGTVSLNDLNATANFLYAVPIPTYSTAMESKLILPSSLAVGYAFRPNEKWTFEVDVEWTDWASVEQELILYPEESNASRLSLLNDGNPVSKDWHDSMAYGIGAQYRANDKLTLRGGYLFIETPIPSANFETALPDCDRHGITLGAGYKLREDLTVDLAYFGVLMVDRDVTNDVASANADLDGEYSGYVNIISVGFTYKY